MAEGESSESLQGLQFIQKYGKEIPNEIMLNWMKPQPFEAMDTLFLIMGILLDVSFFMLIMAAIGFAFIEEITGKSPIPAKDTKKLGTEDDKEFSLKNTFTNFISKITNRGEKDNKSSKPTEDKTVDDDPNASEADIPNKKRKTEDESENPKDK